jgi:RNA polymerase sigma-70 factor (ECF subfamily)
MMTNARDAAGREFARLLVRFDRPLLRYIMTFIPRRDDAEEVLQRTATVIWEKFDEYDRQREFLPWALRVAYFEVLNFRKQIARDRLVFREDVIEALAETRHTLASQLEAQRQALRLCLSELSPDDQALLRRRYGDAETVAALAGERGKTAKALYRRLDRLRDAIARCAERRMKLDNANELS